MGAKLGVLIKDTGKTREAFAPEVGMTARTLYRYIAGKVKALRSLDTLERLAPALDMTRDELQRQLESSD